MTLPNDETTLSEIVVQDIRGAIEKNLPSRIWQKDATVWKSDADAAKVILNRLGWLSVPDAMLAQHDAITEFAEQVRKDGITHVALLGMGGSSLCVEVIRDTFGVKAGYPTLLVLDSTHPDQVHNVERGCDLDHTLFVVASKSGTTLEPECFYAYFWDKLAHLGEARAAHFVAITDPGSELEKLANDLHFRRVFANPPDIGGRYSALSYFGMVPAALIGVDIHEVLSLASSAASMSKTEDDRNLALTLGVFFGEGWSAGRDKLTIVTDPAMRSFGYWAEQLIAESTGKEGKGILPIEGESEAARREQAAKRTTVHITVGDNSLSAEERTQPHVLELHMLDVQALGAQFFRWEFATAIAGSMMGINPFDEPNVAEAKAKTNEVLSKYDGSSPLEFPDLQSSFDRAALDTFLSANVKADGYIAIMAYINRNEASIQALAELRESLSLAHHVPVTVGFGPRFLHSTGQLHKGGAPNGTFIQFVDTPKEDAAIPGKPYTFGTLVRAQAIGDAGTLRAHGRAVVSIDLGSDNIAGTNVSH